MMKWFLGLFKSNSTQQVGIPDLPQPALNDVVTEEQVSRKARSEDVLSSKRVPFIAHLPCIESEAEAVIPTAHSIAERLLALTIVGVKGEGLEQSEVLSFIEKRNALGLFTPVEKEFIDNPEPSDHERLQFSWRYEAAHVLLWALGFGNDRLSDPDQICDVVRLVTEVRDNKALAQCKIRPTAILLDEADLIYRYHWAVRQSSIDGQEAPLGVEPSIVMERHHALNWLIGSDDGEGWDMVPTDT